MERKRRFPKGPRRSNLDQSGLYVIRRGVSVQLPDGRVERVDRVRLGWVITVARAGSFGSWACADVRIVGPRRLVRPAPVASVFDFGKCPQVSHASYSVEWVASDSEVGL